MVVLLPYLWLAIFFLAPFVIVLKISLSQSVLAQPPYTPVLDLTAGWQGLKEFAAQLSLDSFGLLASDSLYLLSYFKSLQVAAISTVLLFALGYPIAYGMARAPKAWQPMLVMAVVLPFWTSFLIRIYAWINILQRDGLLNDVLMRLHIIDTPAAWLSSDTAIYIGMVYSYLPFMVLPLYASLEKMDEFAAGSSVRPWLSGVEGILADHVPAVPSGRCGGCAALVHSDRRRVRHSRSARRFGIADDRADIVDRVLLKSRLAGCIGDSDRSPRLVAGADPLLRASAAAVARRRADMKRGPSPFNIVSVALGLAFLYLPIVILVIYSFNASRLVTVWGGWSLGWYRELLNDEAILSAAWISFRVAFLSATAATVLGTLAAVSLTRMGRFRGRLLFSGMVYAPLVMPEVITGLSLLLLFVALNVDRGFWTVVIAHTTLTTCFVTVIVQSRLIGFDRSLEEAAMDLGCPPFKTFMTITLPLIAPAIAAGWMLAFSLSLDDLVIASFTTGPGATTLPIRIYSEVRLGVKPEINAICTIMIAIVALGTVISSLMIKRGASQRERAALGAQV